MTLDFAKIRLILKNPFTIAHGSSDYRDNVIVKLIEADNYGIGEAAPVKQHHENQESVINYLKGINLAESSSLEDSLNSLPPGPNSAKAAIDIALHDLKAKKLGIPVHRLFGISSKPIPPTSFTLGMAEPEVLRERAKQLAKDFSIIKLKLGAGEEKDLKMFKAVRQAVDIKLVADANCGWTFDEAKTIIPKLADMGLEMIEQPLAEEDLEGLSKLKKLSPIPVFADEPVRNSKDIVRLAGKVDGVNIKLMKSGGLREAYRMIACARAHDLEIMLGCMVESSIGITAVSQLAPLVDHLDLDGNLLIKNDPYKGTSIKNGILKLPEGSGLGIKPNPQANIPFL